MFVLQLPDVFTKFSPYSHACNRGYFTWEYGVWQKEYFRETDQHMNAEPSGYAVDITYKLLKAVAEPFNLPGHSFDHLKLYLQEVNFNTPGDIKYKVVFIRKLNAV